LSQLQCQFCTRIAFYCYCRDCRRSAKRGLPLLGLSLRQLTSRVPLKVTALKAQTAEPRGFSSAFWSSVVRWEMRTRLFLRTTEILRQGRHLFSERHGVERKLQHPPMYVYAHLYIRNVYGCTYVGRKVGLSHPIRELFLFGFATSRIRVSQPQPKLGGFVLFVLMANDS